MFEHEPDFFEKCVRFVCGLLGGAIFGFILLLREESASTHELAICIVGCAAASAFAAVKYGDGFWKFVFTLITWW